MPPAKYIAALCHQRWASDETLPKITSKIPMLFLSGLKDEIVPPIMMKTLFNLCSVENKTWKDFPNGDHNSTVAEPGYFDTIWEFVVEEVMPGNAKEKLDVGETDVKREELWT